MNVVPLVGLPWGLYARVSTEEQAEEGQSIGAQLNALRTWAKDKGYVAREYVDEGKSAYTEDLTRRPDFKRMLDDLYAGQLGGIAVTHIDRFSRKLIVTLTALGELGKRGAGFASLENASFDFSRPADRLLLVVLGAFAEYYSAELSRKILRGFLTRAGKGLHVGTLPFGYCNGKCADCPATCVRRGQVAEGEPALRHPDDAPGVLFAFELYANGSQSDSTIAHALNAKGYRSRSRRGRILWSRYSVEWMLTNPTYTGTVVMNGKEFPGKHPAIISRELFDRVQAVRAQHNRNRGKQSVRHHVYLFNGIIECSLCGKPMHAMTHGKPARRVFLCRSAARLNGEIPHSHAVVQAEPMEREFADLLTGIVLPEDWRAQVLQSLVESGPILDPETERRRLKQKLERNKIVFEEGDKTLEEYRAEREVIRAELNALSVEPDREVLDAGMFLESLGTVWNMAQPIEQREIVHSLVTRVVCSPEQKHIVSFSPRTAFVPFFRQQPNLIERDGVFEFIRS